VNWGSWKDDGLSFSSEDGSGGRGALYRQATTILAGHRVASRVDSSRLTTGFTVLLIAVAGYSLARSLPGLV
jgi:hypothetical protein